MPQIIAWRSYFESEAVMRLLIFSRARMYCLATFPAVVLRFLELCPVSVDLSQSEWSLRAWCSSYMFSTEWPFAVSVLDSWCVLSCRALSISLGVWKPKRLGIATPMLKRKQRRNQIEFTKLRKTLELLMQKALSNLSLVSFVLGFESVCELLT